MKESKSTIIRSILTAIRKLPRVLKFYIIIALIAPLLSGSSPWLISIGNHYYFPAFGTSAYFTYEYRGKEISDLKVNTAWKKLPADFAVYPLVRYDAGKSDLLNSNYISPLDQQYGFDKDGMKIDLPVLERHWLGTGRTGNDLLAGLISGTRTSLLIGFLSILIASLIGIFLGTLAAFGSDSGLKIARWKLIASALLIVPAWFYAFTVNGSGLRDAFHSNAIWGMTLLLSLLCFFFVIVLLPILIRSSSRKQNFFTKPITVSLDFWIMRFTEIFVSLPRLILILTFAAIAHSSITLIILIIGFTSWTEFARITRAEVLKLKSSEFILAARAGGSSFSGILVRHLFPNILPVLSVYIVYGVASAILVETGLSFLGVGVPAGTETWGSLMFEARENFTAWWMVIFPGAALSLLTITLNNYGRRLSTKNSGNSFPS